MDELMKKVVEKLNLSIAMISFMLGFIFGQEELISRKYIIRVIRY